MAHPASACKSFKSPARVIRCIKWSWRLQSWRGAGVGFRRFSTFGPACLPPPPYTQAPLPKEAKKDEMRRGKGGAPCRSRSRSLASPSHALLARSRPRSLAPSLSRPLSPFYARRARSSAAAVPLEVRVGFFTLPPLLLLLPSSFHSVMQRPLAGADGRTRRRSEVGSLRARARRARVSD